MNRFKIFVLFLIQTFFQSLEGIAQVKRGWAATPYLAEGNYSDVPVKDRMQQGNWAAGGNITGGFIGGSLVKNNSYGATAQVGYLLVKRLVTGVQVSYGANHYVLKRPVNNPSLTLEHHHHSFTPEIFTRYYITSYKVKPFVHLSAGNKWLWGTQQKVGGTPLDSRETQFTSSVAAGFCWLIKPKWAIEAMYQHQMTAIAPIVDGNSKTNIRLGLNFFID